LTSRRQSGRLAIEVRDTGVGVKEAEVERIFEHFVSTKPQGLGMGLAISRSIITAHDGRIWATANPDRGLTVHIELPCASTGRPHPDPAHEAVAS
jgi:two-component system sensor kinase FixL